MGQMCRQFGNQIFSKNFQIFSHISHIAKSQIFHMFLTFGAPGLLAPRAVKTRLEAKLQQQTLHQRLTHYWVTLEVQKGTSKETAEKTWRKEYQENVKPEKSTWLDGDADFCKSCLRRWLTQSLRDIEAFLAEISAPLPTPPSAVPAASAAERPEPKKSPIIEHPGYEAKSDQALQEVLQNIYGAEPSDEPEPVGRFDDFVERLRSETTSIHLAKKGVEIPTSLLEMQFGEAPMQALQVVWAKLVRSRGLMQLWQQGARLFIVKRITTVTLPPSYPQFSPNVKE